MVPITVRDERKDMRTSHARLPGSSWYQKLMAVAREIIPEWAAAPVSVVCVDAGHMRALNARYRKISRVTDVLSFATTDGGGRLLEGDIIICPEQAYRQRHRFKTTETQELARLFFHGLLHLYGYDHIKKSERAIMRSLESRLMKSSDI